MFINSEYLVELLANRKAQVEEKPVDDKDVALRLHRIPEERQMVQIQVRTIEPAFPELTTTAVDRYHLE